MSSASYMRERRLRLIAMGLCHSCARKPPAAGRMRCEACLADQCRISSLRIADGRAFTARTKSARTPGGWAGVLARFHRTRVRLHNAAHPDFPLLEKIIDGPALLARIIAHGPTCGLCGTHTGFPWEHVGKETGPDVDHILSMWACINDGRQDWASVSNVRLLCVGCHRIDGVRLKRQDLENHTAMLQALDKDRT